MFRRNAAHPVIPAFAGMTEMASARMRSYRNLYWNRIVVLLSFRSSDSVAPLSVT